ncbi:MAG: MBL fold metallo-hydrolase [Candidatus Thermoplasmatota archaeon]|nr:MBL fold metallo-hydrolase [Candidatus Thermoplasmatota archaeon]
MKIHCVYGQSYDSNIYVVEGKHPTIIDCGTGLYHDTVAKQINSIIDPHMITQIILTHEHYDHVGGIKKLQGLTGKNATIFAHKYAANKIERGESMFARMLGGVMPKMPVDVHLDEGDTIAIGDEQSTVLYTPGHTPGSLCLYAKESNSLISGDTIFSHGSFGRYDLPGGDGALLKQSIERVGKLEITNLYPGHEECIEGNAKQHIELTLKNSRYLI